MQGKGFIQLHIKKYKPLERMSHFTHILPKHTQIKPLERMSHFTHRLRSTHMPEDMEYKLLEERGIETNTFAQNCESSINSQHLDNRTLLSRGTLLEHMVCAE